MDTAVIDHLISVDGSSILEEKRAMKEDTCVVGMEYVWFDSLADD